MIWVDSETEIDSGFLLDLGMGREVQETFIPQNRPSQNQPQPKPDFGEYLDGLYGCAMALSRNRGAAEDLVQETCLRALRSMHSLRAAGSQKSWLFTILRNIWLNQLRHQRTLGEIVELDADGSEPNEPVDRAPDPHTDYVRKLEREQVRIAIRELPVEFREVIMLREYAELSYQEIAAILECPAGTVMSRLARARSRLRTLLVEVSNRPDNLRNGNRRAGRPGSGRWLQPWESQSHE